MKRGSLFCVAAVILGLVSCTAIAEAQTSGLIPPSLDPSVWGRANVPYTAKAVVSTTPIVNGTKQQTETQQEKITRDNAGRVRTESFYQDGHSMTIMLRDPSQKTGLMLFPATKTGAVLSISRPSLPPSGKGWIVVSLPTRTIAGMEAEGQRFTRTVPAEASKNGEAVTIVEDVWMSLQLDIVLARDVRNPLTGTSTELVTQVERVQPDPGLFEVPTDYVIEQLPFPVP